MRLRSTGSVSPSLALVGVAISAVAIVAVVLASHFERAQPAASRPIEPLVAWCADGLEPIAGGGCFAAADDASDPKLIVYLHGRYASTTAGTRDELARQARVASLATKRGYSVLALRGREGQCPRSDVAEFFCWPSNDATKDAGAEYVRGWSPAVEAAEGRIGHGSRFLLGFSNGGYFAAIIVARELMPFAAVAIAGAGSVEALRARSPEPPILLLTADGDPSVTSMMRFDDELTREQWPHSIVTRDGEHGLFESDVASALVFFDRAVHERFPLSPPMSLRRPSPTAPSGFLNAGFVAAAFDPTTDAAADDDATPTDTTIE